MKKKILFDSLGKEESKLLLKAFDYDVDKKGYILKSNGQKIPSEERPNCFLNIKNAALIPGSLEVIDASPTSLAKYIRESENNAHRPYSNL